MMKLKYLALAFLLSTVLIISGCQAAAVTTTPNVPPATLSNNVPTSAAVTAATTVPASTNPAITTTTTVPASATPAVTSTSPGAKFPITIIDAVGRSVTLKAMPRSIVSLSPSNTEMVFALGLGDQLVGVTKFCNYPEAAKTKNVLGGFSDVNLERVVIAKPDLILAGSLHVAKVVPALERLNIPVLVFRSGTIEGILDDITQLGAITGKAEEAKAITADLRKRVEAVTAKIGGAKAEKPRILYVTWHDPIWTSGDDTVIGELIRKAGGINVTSELSGYANITLESVIQKNPQIIIVMSSMGDQVSMGYITSEPRLQAVEARKNNRVYMIDADLFGRTTPRIVDALEQLAKIVQPGLFN